MRRVLSFLLRNWPLKLGAIVLASVLYAGLVLAQNTRTWPGRVPIEAVRPPAGAVVLEQTPAEVTLIRYRAPVDVVARLTVDDFRATADLAGRQPEAGGPPQTVAVNLRALDSRVEVVDYEPKTVSVRLDPVVRRQLPVRVSHNAPPAGLRIGQPTVDPQAVSVRGASTLVQRITQIAARVTIDDSGLNVDSEVDLVPLDDRGDVVPRVELVPERARVGIQVARILGNRTLPITPQFAGTPAEGYEVTSVVIDPLTVDVSGEEVGLEGLARIPTQPIDMTGRTEGFETTVALALPPEITGGTTEARVTVGIAPQSGSRSYQAGIVTTGARPDRLYALSTPTVVVVLGGRVIDLSAVAPATLSVSVDVAALGPGTHEVPIRVEPPRGTQLVTVTPPTIGVTVAAAPPPSPATVPAPPGSSPAVSAAP